MGYCCTIHSFNSFSLFDADHPSLAMFFECQMKLYVDCCRWILKNVGDDLTEADIDDMIADVDTDGSGWVDYNGLSTFFTLALA